MKLFFYISFLLIHLHVLLYCQPDSDSLIQYTPEYKFQEGLYQDFQQVKNNKPIPKSRIISSENYDDPEFFETLLSEKTVYYYDNLGNRGELQTTRLWGYSRNGYLYIQVEDGFYRITLIGSICHFVASHTTYTNYYNNPYNYGYSYPYYMPPNSYPTSEVRQYLLDFGTGRVFDYNSESIEILLMADPELHDQYVSLSNKKKKQQKFVFVRKFNEKHPLYFPQN